MLYEMLYEMLDSMKFGVESMIFSFSLLATRVDSTRKDSICLPPSTRNGIERRNGETPYFYLFISFIIR